MDFISNILIYLKKYIGFRHIKFNLHSPIKSVYHKDIPSRKTKNKRGQSCKRDCHIGQRKGGNYDQSKHYRNERFHHYIREI